jgi:uncharacterized membrane protein
MRAKLQNALYYIRSSYWFVPTVMAIVAIILSQVTVAVDRAGGAEWATTAWWVSFNEPEGARSLLATVAGSMITVTGVTFSLTILAVSYGTSHFGPRLLDNFMQDRGNQVTLGTFVATFLYCLLVLRTVRSASSAADTRLAEAFVPNLSVSCAIVLTLASVGVLIYFIHHIPETIHISNVLNRIAQNLDDKIDQLYPQTLGEAADQPQPEYPPPGRSPLKVVSTQSGYLQGIDTTGLMAFTRQSDAITELLVRPGDFVLDGQRIATVFRSDPTDSSPQACADSIRSLLAIGIARTPTQDLHFLLNQLVEIAALALSPGVNDPFTAIQSIDQLSTAITRLAGRQIPSRFRRDDEGQLRVITTASTWEDVVAVPMRRLFLYVRDDMNVTRHMLDRLSQIRQISVNDDLNRVLDELASELSVA